jgi:rubrerythrin
MLAGKGFKDVLNLSGGFKAWKSKAAFGPEDQGLELFSGMESPATALVVAYGLEAGLHDFYLSMIPKVNNNEVKDLFQKLSEIEIKHQERIFSEYVKMTGSSETKADFEKSIVSQAVEGGLTTEEYINRFGPDWDSAIDIIELAMSIEAQALDLYQRASERRSDPQSQKALVQIADEERSHLAQLGKLIERIHTS